MMDTVWSVLHYMQGGVTYTDIMGMEVTAYIHLLRWVRRSVEAEVQT
jgi:hypothetical protein